MNQPKSRRANPILWAWVACAAALGGACANGASSSPSSGDIVPTQGSSSSSGGSQGGSSGSSSGPQQGCTTCETDDAGSTPTGDEAGSGTPPTDDAGTTGAGDDASSGTGSGDDAGGISISSLFPDGGLGGSPPASTDDGGANMCTTKICIDPVFDCPLQGCFNGCTDFHCN